MRLTQAPRAAQAFLTCATPTALGPRTACQARLSISDFGPRLPRESESPEGRVVRWPGKTQHVHLSMNIR